MPEYQARTFGLETWEKGHRGARDAFFYDQAWIQNLRLYPDGSLGPRPEWDEWGTELASNLLGSSITDVIVPASSVSTWNGAVTNGWLQVRSGDIRFTYLISPTSRGETIGPSVGSTAGPHGWITRIGAYEWVINGIYILMVGTITATDIRAAVESRFSGALTYNYKGSAVHNGRCFMWGPMLNGSSVPSNENRVYYSDAYAYATFTSASQYFDVDGPVAGCASLGSSLLIWTDANDWYILQGQGDPADGVLHKLGKGRIPEYRREPAVFDNNLVFEASDRTATVAVSESGQVDDRTYEYLHNATNAKAYYEDGAPPARASSVQNTMIIPFEDDQSGAFHFYRGVWTREDWSTLLGQDAFSLYYDEVQTLETMVVWDSGNSGWVPLTRNVYSDDPTADSSTLYETPEGLLYLPRVWVPNRQVRPVRIIVDGKAWKAGSIWRTTDITLRTYDGSALHSWVLGPGTDMLGDLPTAAPGPFRFTFTPSEEQSMDAFFDIQISGMVSLGILQITVEYEVSDQELFL